MSSNLTLSGGPAANQDYGPGNPPTNTIQNEFNSQPNAVPGTPEVQSQMSEVKKTEGDENCAAETPKPEPAISPSKTEEDKETTELCVKPDLSNIQQNISVASVCNTIDSEKLEHPQNLSEAPKIEENAEMIETSEQTETKMEKPALTDNISESIKEKEEKETTEENSNVEEESVFIDAVDLTEQIMNIINDGKSEILSHPQELLKKNVELQEFILKLVQVLKEKTNLCANLERQNTALIGQAQSLKDVIAITKDLLGIRNMEVEHLHADMSSMESRIKEERIRHNTAVARLNEAMQINDKLKAEYLIQMDLFQKLRDKYNEKVVVLTKENQRLNEIVKSNCVESSIVPEESAENSTIDNGLTPEEITDENVDK